MKNITNKIKYGHKCFSLQPSNESNICNIILLMNFFNHVHVKMSYIRTKTTKNIHYDHNKQLSVALQYIKYVK